MKQLVRSYAGKLRHPPETALAFQLFYVAMIAQGINSPFVHAEGSLDALLATISGVFCIAGGVVGAASQYRGLWFLERGALTAVWSGLLFRVVVVARLQDAPPPEMAGRAVVLAALCLLLIPRFRSIRGADQDPSK